MDNGTVVTSVIGASAATIAVIISKEAKISEFRQQWIDALRADISRECAVLQSLHAHHRREAMRDAQQEQYEELGGEAPQGASSEEWAEFYANGLEANELSVRIALRLDLQPRKNPRKHAKKRASRELHRLIGTAHILAGDRGVHFADLSAHLNKVRDKASEVLEEAWTRVKRGEALYRIVLWCAMTSLVLSIAFAVWSGFRSTQQRPTLDVTVTTPIKVEQKMLPQAQPQPGAPKLPPVQKPTSVGQTKSEKSSAHAQFQ